MQRPPPEWHRLAPKGNLIYGGQSYDCIVVLALAAEAAGSFDGRAIAHAAVEISGPGGTDCFTFAERKGLLEAGEDIDYAGISGPINLVRGAGSADPSFGRYAIGVLGDGTLEIIGEQDVDLSELR